MHLHICFSNGQIPQEIIYPPRVLDASNLYTNRFYIKPKSSYVAHYYKHFVSPSLGYKIEEGMHTGDYDTTNVTRKYIIHHKIHIDDYKI